MPKVELKERQSVISPLEDLLVKTSNGFAGLLFKKLDYRTLARLGTSSVALYNNTQNIRALNKLLPCLNNGKMLAHSVMSTLFFLCMDSHSEDKRETHENFEKIQGTIEEKIVFILDISFHKIYGQQQSLNNYTADPVFNKKLNELKEVVRTLFNYPKEICNIIEGQPFDVTYSEGFIPICEKFVNLCVSLQQLVALKDCLTVSQNPDDLQKYFVSILQHFEKMKDMYAANSDSDEAAHIYEVIQKIPVEADQKIHYLHLAKNGYKTALSVSMIASCACIVASLFMPALPASILLGVILTSLTLAMISLIAMLLADNKNIYTSKAFDKRHEDLKNYINETLQNFSTQSTSPENESDMKTTDQKTRYVMLYEEFQKEPPKDYAFLEAAPDAGGYGLVM